MKKWLYIFACAMTVMLMFTFCGNGHHKKNGQAPPTPSCNFYYWKTSLDFDKEDKALADSLGLRKLYVRYFDVDWSPTLNMPVPLGELSEEWERSIVWGNHTIHIQDLQMVPTVFLTNRVFAQAIDVDSLAAKMTRKIKNITDGFQYSIAPGWGPDYDNAEASSNWQIQDSLVETAHQQFLARMTEIQVDCDWTPTTKDRYFAFLKAMKNQNPGIDITCTVRLHQFRDRDRSGIPPVDRATLMCYNVAPPKDPGVADAIFDEKLVAGYLKNGKYPLLLEAALPLFGWGALFHENEFKGLASGLTEKDVKGNPLFAEAGENRYRFTQDTVFAEIYMREGDVVRLDAPSATELEELAAHLAGIGAVQGLSFFDWDMDKIHSYHVDKIVKKFSDAK
ncbi:MAG: hypothetical protein H6577_24515 [Lewinellaceae bacterium]|nr:hypothetical protein [Saprospiraceae bacterium]MCB9341299.1 hypothetical protein [Lewinellaceae bacterium]